MAKLIACTRCESQIDVTNAPAGSTVRCSECNSLVRISTGTAEPIPSVPQAPPVARPSRRGGGRRDPLFNKFANARPPGGGTPRGGRSTSPRMGRRGAAPAKKSNTPVIIGVVVGVLAVLAIVIVIATRGDKPPASKEGGNDVIMNVPEPGSKPPPPKPEPAPAAPGKTGKEEKKTFPTLTKSEKGSYSIPDSFEPGAKKHVELRRSGIMDLGLDNDLKSEYESLAKSGNVSSIIEKDYKWMPYIIDGLLSEDETAARTTYQSLHDICEKHKIWAADKEHMQTNPIKMKQFNSAIARAGEYEFWGEWYLKNKEAVASWEGGGKLVVQAYADKENWDDLMSKLRVGGGYDDMSRPEGVAYAKVKSMGKSAYPHLIRYIGNEDLMLARAAVSVLNELTGRTEPLPRPDTRETIRGRWEKWLEEQ